MTEEFGDKDTLDADPTYSDDLLTEFVTVNGQYQPKVSMQPGEYVRMRFVNANGNGVVELEFGDMSKDNCKMWIIARDGVYHDAPWEPSTNIIFPAGRADVVAMCMNVGSFTFSINNSASRDGLFGSSSSVKEDYRLHQDVLFTLEVSGTTVTDMSLPTALPERTGYLSDLTSTTEIDGEYCVFMTAAGGVSSCTEYDDAHSLQIAGGSFTGHEDYRYTMDVGSVQEWWLGGGLHPFHM
jgi:FtsP/CotA-like multicopper oxidase with cupredoxin domain